MTALESMTLPSRLKSRDGLLGSLDKIVEASNVNGNQQIARLQMSVRANPEQKQLNGGDRVGRLDPLAHMRDPRLPSQDGSIREIEDADEVPNSLDICLFPTDESNQNPERRKTKRLHIFGQAENVRGGEYLPSTNADEASSERVRRRAAGLPIIHRSVASEALIRAESMPKYAGGPNTKNLWAAKSMAAKLSPWLTVLHRTKTPLPFSILDSFPHIYYQSPSGVHSRSVSVRTLLSTDSSVALWIRNMTTIVNRSVGIDERESIINSLSGIAEAYEEGWDSGSDEGDND
jgi:hypothetical protein